MTKEILGVIAYLDSVEVDNMLASIEGGLVDQFVEKSKESRSRKGEASLGIPGAVGGGGSVGSVQEEASEAIKRTTPVSRLSALRRILIDNGYIRYINVVDGGLRGELIEGQLVEIHGEIRISAFGEWVDIVVGFLDLGMKFSGLFGQAMKITPSTEQGIRYLEHVTGKGVPVYVACPTQSEAKRGFEFACILNPGNLSLAKGSLNGAFTLLGRVNRVLSRNEVLYLYDLIPGMSRIPRNQLKALVESFSKKTMPGFNLTITENDLRLAYPAVVISPIAMYS